MMIGWLGAAYLWVKAAHVIFVIFWIAALFMLPRFLVYHHNVKPGSAEDAQWIDREAKLRRIILTPAMLAVWVFGLMLALNIGFAGNGWLHAKIALVLGLSGYHGWLVGTAKRFARGERPGTERFYRMMNEIPGIVVAFVVVLVIVRPF